MPRRRARCAFAGPMARAAWSRRRRSIAASWFAAWERLGCWRYTERMSGVWAEFAALAAPYRWRFLGGFALLLVTNGLGLTIPWLLRDAVGALERSAPARTIAGFALAMIALALAQAGVRTLSRFSVLGASRDLAFDLRQRFFAQLSRLDAPWYDAHRTGDVMSRGVNDIQLVQMVFGPGMLNLLNTTIVYVAALVLMWHLDARLT